MDNNSYPNPGGPSKTIGPQHMKSYTVSEPSKCAKCGGALDKQIEQKYNRFDLVAAAFVGGPVIGGLVLLGFAGMRKLAFLAAAAVAFGLYYLVASRNIVRWRCRACGSTTDENRGS